MSHSTTIEIVRGSVVEQDVDAIVNAANTALRGGGGIDGVIHRAAGKGLLAELEKVAPNGAKTGAVVITGGHNLRQPYIIHTPGPVWKGGNANESERLASCYQSCLERAEEKGLRSIAFCSISTGIYGYPLDRAAPVALNTVRAYLDAHPDTALERVVFAMYQVPEYAAFRKAWAAIQAEEPGE
jgi:O-acetyl-ADP-ribose deacetylase (regulator of RNase III)